MSLRYHQKTCSLGFFEQKGALPCLYTFCSENVIFFEGSGLDHHMRVIHNNKVEVGDIQITRSVLCTSQWFASGGAVGHTHEI